MSKTTFALSRGSSQPYPHPFSPSPKEDMRKVRSCFKKLQNQLGKAEQTEGVIGMQFLLHKYSPTDFPRSTELLKATEFVCEKLSSFVKPLVPGHPLLQSVNELQEALQDYNHNLFGSYFKAKSAKENTSFIDLKYPFISWCLQQAERSFKETRIAEAQNFWSFCDRLLPAEFHQGLTFKEDEKKIQKAIDLIRELLNAKRTIHEKLSKFSRTVHTTHDSCNSQHKVLLTNLLRKIEAFKQKSEERYDATFYEYQIQQLQELQKPLVGIQELNPIREGLETPINELKALHSKSLDYEILTLQDKMQVIERVLSKVRYDLDKGVPVTGLVKELLWDQVQGFCGNKQLIVRYLELHLWVLENKKRLIESTVSVFQSKFAEIIALLKDLTSEDSLKRASHQTQVSASEDAEFEARLLALIEAFSSFIKAENIEAAAGKAQELIQALKKFQPIDLEQEKQVRKQCELFSKANEDCKLKAKNFRKNEDPQTHKNWQIIANALRVVGEGKLLKKKPGPLPAFSSTQLQYQELLERIQRFKEALENHRFSQALAICEELRNSTRKLGLEALSQLEALLVWVEQEGHLLLISSNKVASENLTEIGNTLYQVFFRLVGAGEQGAGVSSQCAEMVGEAYLQIYEKAQYQSHKKKEAAERAIFWFEMVLEKRPKNASLLFKLGPLYQYLGNEEEMWGAYKKACRIQPDYFEAVNRTGCEYVNEGKRDEMLELYLESVKYPFLSDQFSIDSSSQICLHRNLIRELIRRKNYEKAFPLLVKLKVHLLNNAYYRKHILDEVAYWLTLVPEEISHFTVQDFEELIECCSSMKTEVACKVRVYQHYNRADAQEKAEEYKWKTLAGRAVTSERYGKMYEAQGYCQFRKPETNTKAIGLYESIIQQWPFYVPAYYCLYKLHVSMQNHKSAEETYQKMLKLPLPGFTLRGSFEQIWEALEEQGIDPDFFCEAADYFRREKKNDLAEKLYRKALEMDPHHMNAYYGMGCLFRKSNRIREACEQFQVILDIYETVTTDPLYIRQRYFNFLIQFGSEYTQPLKARERYRAANHVDQAYKAIKKDYERQKPECLSRVCLQLADLVEPGEAISHLSAAIRLQPKNYKAYIAKFKRVRSIDQEEAVRCLQQAILCYPGFHQESYQQLQELLRSYSVAKAALVYQSIGEEFFKQQRVEEALCNLEKAHELTPNSQKTHLLLGACYTKQKRYQAAYNSFNYAGEVAKAQQVLDQGNRFCRLTKYGDFFRDSLERIRHRLHELRIAEMRDIFTCVADQSTGASPIAKNKRQEILIQSQNLLNQAMQLFSTCFQQAYPEEGDITDEFPVRNMVARQQEFDSSIVKTLLADFKEKTPELYKFLKEYYLKEYEQIEGFIQQANSEKHAQHGEQSLRSQVTITMDYRNNTKTTSVRPMFYDEASCKNPAEDCNKIIEHVEHLINAIFAHIDHRLSKTSLRSIIKREDVSNQIWTHLVSIGWISNEGEILVDTQEPLKLEKFKQYESLVIGFMKKIAESPKVVFNFETHFDLERSIFLRDDQSQPKSPCSHQDSTLEDLAKNYVAKAQQLAQEGAPDSAITILKQWAKWHQSPMEAFGLLGDLLWNKEHYYEALQAYHSAEISQLEKEQFWKSREGSWGDVAFQIEEAKKLLYQLNIASQAGSHEVLNLHEEIVAKLTHSLDHAIHAYSKTRFALPEKLDPVVLKELFFPIAGEDQKPEERIEQVFGFLNSFNKSINDDEPEFFKYLCQIQPYADPSYRCLWILHDAINIEKHRRFLLCKSEDKAIVHQNLYERQNLKFYWDAIKKFEEIHEQIAYFKNA